MKPNQFDRLVFVSLVLGLMLATGEAQEIERLVSREKPEPEVTASWWSADIAAVLARAPENREQLTAALLQVPARQRESLAFLLQNMPPHDLRSLTAEYLLENVALAHEARQQAPWGPLVPDEIFLNDVLPYACVNERRDRWRQDFLARFLPLVKEASTPGEAAHLLNKKVFGILGVKYSTRRKKADQSPLESMESGLASCTGLSILLIDACRAVGVPARLAGIPSWVNKRGNHSWVEIWDDGWHFAGAAEPDHRGLDHAWFVHDASLAIKDSPRHAIYASSFRKTDLRFPLVWARNVEYVSAVNVTDHYVRGKESAPSGNHRLLVRVQKHDSGERVEANVEVMDVDDVKKVLKGKSRDESADTNDILAFAVSKGSTYEVRVQADGRTAVRRYRPGEEEEDTLTITLNDDLSTPPPECWKPDPQAFVALKNAVGKFFTLSSEQRSEYAFPEEFDVALRDHEKAVRAVVWDAYQHSPLHTDLKADFAESRVRFREHLSPYSAKKVGRRPSKGWPLFIAMHGGGGTAKRVNDSQWRVMQSYYRDQESVEGYLYVALRAPNDRWNGFYDDYVYPLVANLIKQLVLFSDVDPDKVFIMGYSHGGYGAFAIGPKMPDRFAAIHSSAAAPTDRESSPKTLRNTVFTYMIGEHDHAYGRLKRCKAFDAAIRELRGDRTQAYPVTMEYKAGHRHGGLPDRDKIGSMYPAVRNSVPRELTWEMTDTVIRDFFWLSVPDPAKKKEVDAQCQDNRIELCTRGVDRLTVWLDQRLVDLQRPISLVVNGRLSELSVLPSLKTLCSSLIRRGDMRLAFTCRIDWDASKDAVAGPSWPQFRGPSGQGHTEGKGLPLRWSETKNVTWRTTIPGRGWSSPVIDGGTVWMTSAIESPVSEEEKARRTAGTTNSQPLAVSGDLSLRAVAVDAVSGALVHDIEVLTKKEPQPIHTLNSFASPTPVIDSGRLYCHFGAYGTACVETSTATVLWRQQGIRLNHENGPGGSPVLWGDRLIFHCDGSDVQFIVALDKESGKIAWKTQRSGTMHENPQLKKAYGTPLIIDVDGTPQLISPAANWLYAYDPENGRELWKLSYDALGFSIVPRPVVGHGMIYMCTSFMRSELLAVRFQGEKGFESPRIAWRYKRQVPQMPSPLLVGEELYIVSDKGGIASCIDAKTGNVLWRERLGGNYSASPLHADGRIYFLNREGITTVIRSGREFERLAENRLDGMQMASPAALGDALFLRTDKALYRIEAEKVVHQR